MRSGAAALGLLALLAGAGGARAQGSVSEREVVIQQRRPASATEVSLPARPASQLAGTQGDPVKALQSVPGVGPSGASGGELSLWGAAPNESRVELDGVEIPWLFHGSGVRSVLPPGLLAAVHATPGAYGAAYGRAVGGRVELLTAAPSFDARQLRAHADLLDAGLLASAPLPSIDAAAGAAFRYGYVDRWLPRLIDPELRGLYRVPSYWDAHAELAKKLPDGAVGRLVAVSSADSRATDIASADPARRQLENETARFGRLYFAYEKRQERASTSVTPFVGWDFHETALTSGQEQAGLRARELRYGLRAEHREALSARVTLTLGLDIAGSVAHVARRGSLAIPRREGSPFPFGTPPGPGAAYDDFRTHVLSVAPYLELPLRLPAGLSVTPALRFEPTLIEASRARPPQGSLPTPGTSRIDAALEPRLGVRQRIAPWSWLFAAVGRYHQAPAAADLSAVFGNPALPSASGSHVAFGQNAIFMGETQLDVTLFGTWLNGLATPSRASEPALGQALVARGSGRSFGIQGWLRGNAARGFSGWLSATLSRSERREPGGAWRPSDYDTPLVLAASGLQSLGRWRFGTRARFATGAPRTPVVGAYYDLEAQRYQPQLGATNSVRLRDFFQLDLRVDRQFFFGGGDAPHVLELYLDLLNVTAQKNEEQWAYSSDFSTIASVRGLPPLALFGVTLQ